MSDGKTIVFVSINEYESNKLKSLIEYIADCVSSSQNQLRTKNGNCFRFLNVQKLSESSFRGIGIDIVYFVMRDDDPILIKYLDCVVPIVSSRANGKIIISEKFNLDHFI